MLLHWQAAMSTGLQAKSLWQRGHCLVEEGCIGIYYIGKYRRRMFIGITFQVTSSDGKSFVFL
jgi:hypothetical protein